MSKSRLNDLHSNESNPVRTRLQNRIAERNQQVHLVITAAMVNIAQHYNQVDINLAYEIIGKEIQENFIGSNEWEEVNQDIPARLRSSTDNAYLPALKAANVTQEIIDRAKSQTISMEKEIIPFQDAYYTLLKQGHTSNSVFNLFVTMDKKRIPLIPAQAEAIYHAERESGSWNENHQIEEMITGFLNPNVLKRASITDRGPFVDCWDYNDLVSPQFAAELREKGRYLRLYHEYIQGDLDPTEQPGQNYKFLAELQMRGIIVNKWNYMSLNFVQGFDSVLENPYEDHVSNAAKCQLQAVDPKRCLRSPLFNSIIPLTNDSSTCQTLLDELKRHGIIKQDTQDSDEKIAKLMSEWPQVAETRVLNNSVSAFDYLGLQQISSPISSSYNNYLLSVPVVMSIVFLAYLINLVRIRMERVERPGLFKPSFEDRKTHRSQSTSLIQQPSSKHPESHHQSKIGTTLLRNY